MQLLAREHEQLQARMQASQCELIRAAGPLQPWGGLLTWYMLTACHRLQVHSQVEEAQLGTTSTSVRSGGATHTDTH